MDNKYYLTSKKELYHYGVKGMKWGVRRYQNKDGTLTAKGKERYRNTKSGMSRFAGMASKRVLNMGYAPDVFREVLAYENSKGDFEHVEALDDDILKSRRRQDYLDDPDSVFEKHASKVNQKRGRGEYGTWNNCTKVAANMCMARMGLDYEAGRSETGDRDAFEYWFRGEEKSLYDNLSEAIDLKLSKTSPGSFGTVDMRRKDGGGHVFNWQRKSTGEFMLTEGQPAVPEHYKGSSEKDCFDQYMNNHNIFNPEATVCIFDMTNAKPDYEAMIEDSVCRITDDPDYESLILSRINGEYYRKL